MNLLKTHISQYGSFETSNMRKFYQTHPKQDAVRPVLGLIHYNANKYDFPINCHKEVIDEVPGMMLKKLKLPEKEVMAYLEELEAML
ncbi:hypothetical protein MNBD_GAMMA10-534 [hydrothermal vent metagenome]|uniref:Uncharacterized protein n=1 Tax=hydrothermal vent metagenome TaxID=652676 RepID=A0A3B0XEH1_9ZZZZ